MRSHPKLSLIHAEEHPKMSQCWEGETSRPRMQGRGDKKDRIVCGHSPAQHSMKL